MRSDIKTVHSDIFMKEGDKYMNKNQLAFCHEYVNNGLNGTQAYLKVYKNVKKEETAMTNASRLLRNAKVKEYIETLQKELREKAIMTAEERMEWLSKVVKGEIKEVDSFYREDGTVEFEKEPRLDTKRQCIDLLNKMTGEYVTKIEGDIGATIRVDIEDE